MKKAFCISAAILLLSSCNSGKVRSIIHRGETKTDSIVVRVVSAGIAGNAGAVTYVGTVKASRKADLSARNSGTLRGLSVRVGDAVSAGQTLAVVESERITSTYDAAKASLHQAEDGWNRISRVSESGGVPEVKMVEAATRLQQARSAESASRKAVEEMKIVAPFSGAVSEVSLSDGVKVTVAERILELVDLSSLEIHFPVPENEYNAIYQGAEAFVTVPAAGREFPAKVRTRGIVASMLSHSYDCVLGLPSDVSGIMPGMVCKVRMMSGKAASIVIPSSALMTDMDGRYVWTVSDNVVGKKYVSTGGFSGDGVLILAGLEEGDKVIVEGSRKVSTGMRVKTVE